MTYTSYTIKQGDRLDLIAYNAYGSLTTIFPNGLDAIGSILAANQDLAADYYPEPGQVIYIPVFNDANLQSANLPPWLQ